MAEVILRHGAGLRFLGATPLSAASSAGKSVVVQERPGQRLRVVVFSGANLERLDTGPLVHLSFEASGGGDAALEVAFDESAFAPATLYPRPETLELSRSEEGTP